MASVERYPRSISIRCSSETRLLSSPRCTAEADVDEAVLPASSAERVALPATPSADRPASRWKALTASSVAEPK